ncbi:MAG: hypothetical protein R2751_14515 [Bacteroidales bacterium]
MLEMARRPPGLGDWRGTGAIPGSPPPTAWELIARALEEGCQDILVGIGGRLAARRRWQPRPGGPVSG